MHVVSSNYIFFLEQNGQHGSGHKTEQVLQVDGHGSRHKFLILSTGSVNITKSIGMSNMFVSAVNLS